MSYPNPFLSSNQPPNVNTQNYFKTNDSNSKKKLDQNKKILFGEYSNQNSFITFSSSNNNSNQKQDQSKQTLFEGKQQKNIFNMNNKDDKNIFFQGIGNSSNQGTGNIFNSKETENTLNPGNFFSKNKKQEINQLFSQNKNQTTEEPLLNFKFQAQPQKNDSQFKVTVFDTKEYSKKNETPSLFSNKNETLFGNSSQTSAYEISKQQKIRSPKNINPYNSSHRQQSQIKTVNATPQKLSKDSLCQPSQNLSILQSLIKNSLISNPFQIGSANNWNVSQKKQAINKNESQYNSNFSFGKQSKTLINQQKKIDKVCQISTKKSQIQAKKSDGVLKPNLSIEVSPQKLKVQEKSEFKLTSAKNKQPEIKKQPFFNETNVEKKELIQKAKKQDYRSKILDIKIDDQYVKKYYERKQKQQDQKRKMQQRLNSLKKELLKALNKTEINQGEYQNVVSQIRKNNIQLMEQQLLQKQKKNDQLRNKKSQLQQEKARIQAQIVNDNVMIDYQIDHNNIPSIGQIKSPKNYRQYNNFNLVGNNKQLIQQDKIFKQLQNQENKLIKIKNKLAQKILNCKNQIHLLSNSENKLNQESIMINKEDFEISVISDNYDQQLKIWQQKSLKYYKMSEQIKRRLKNVPKRQSVGSRGKSDIYLMNSGINQ